MKLYDPEATKARLNTKRAKKGLPPLTGTPRECRAQMTAESKLTAAQARASQHLTALNVRIGPDGNVYPTGLRSHALLGPLAGSRAELGEPSQAHRVAGPVLAGAVIGPVALLGTATKKTSAAAYVSFPSGTLHTAHAQGKLALRMLEKDVARYNALASAAASPA